MLEVKWSDDQPAKAFKIFVNPNDSIEALQIVGQLDREKHYPFGLKIVSAGKYFSNLAI